MNQNLLFLQIEVFYIQLQAGRYDHPHNLARKLEELANKAWDEVDDIYSLPKIKDCE